MYRQNWLRISNIYLRDDIFIVVIFPWCCCCIFPLNSLSVFSLCFVRTFNWSLLCRCSLLLVFLLHPLSLSLNIINNLRTSEFHSIRNIFSSFASFPLGLFFQRFYTPLLLYFRSLYFVFFYFTLSIFYLPLYF